MRRPSTLLAAIVGSALILSCGGGSGGSTPAAPTPTPPPSGGSDAGPVVISIVGERGRQSFSPNPAQVPDGRMVVWRNIDVIIHRVVLNDRSVDTGDILPGQQSAPMQLGGVSKPYHCSLHPAMVGSLNEAETEEPPNCGEEYC